MKNWKATLVEFLTAIALALLILALVPAARAADTPQRIERDGPYAKGYAVVDCDGTSCTVPLEVMVAGEQLKEQMFEEIKRLRKELDARKCAVLEVEPPKRGGRS